MTLPKNILYPVDFSERCRAVWPEVLGVARQLDAPLTLFHALDLDHLASPEMVRERLRIREYCEERLARFLEPSAIPEYVRREIAVGPAAEGIVGRAANMNEPLIMMPTRGHTRFRQLLLGSVTAAVLHDAECPVWTEAHTEEHVSHDGVYRSLVCAVDMSPRTPDLLRAACQFSHLFGADLHVVHSVPRGDQRFSSGLSNRAHALLVDKAREDYAAHCREGGVDLPLEIAEKSGITEGVCATIVRQKGDLLIIGRGVIQGVLGRLRTNAHDLIRQSPCPVLSI